MIYEIKQVIECTYASSVPFAQHIVRIEPADRAGQRVIAASVEVLPRPISRSESVDFFGNRTVRIDLDTPHDRLLIQASARVRVDAALPFLPDLTPPWHDVKVAAALSNDLGPQSPAHFVFPSRLLPLSLTIQRYAAKSFPKNRPILLGAMELMRRMNADFIYDPGTTDVTTLPEVAFNQRRGVCQDFAHIMITGMRALGLPAAYVSGYLRTEPGPGQKRLEGADATHAWVMVWCGEAAGWCGLDPTNAVTVADDHIVVAIGRDYADVAPVDGVIVASGDHTLHNAVDVMPQYE
jgi:transglutaminase-like putative cysteine protease